MSNTEELFLEKDGKYAGSYCPVVEFEERENGLLFVDNGIYEYEIPKSDYDTYRIAECDCESTKWVNQKTTT